MPAMSASYGATPCYIYTYTFIAFEDGHMFCHSSFETPLIDISTLCYSLMYTMPSSIFTPLGLADVWEVHMSSGTEVRESHAGCYCQVACPRHAVTSLPDDNGRRYASVIRVAFSSSVYGPRPCLRRLALL